MCSSDLTLPQCGNEQIIETVVVVIADRNTESVHGDCQSGLAGNVGKCAVVIIVVELESGRATVRMAGEIFAVDQDDIRISIIVVVNESAAGAHGFGQPLLPESTVVVSEMDSGLSGNIAEMNLGLGGDYKTNRHQRRRHGGTEESREKVQKTFSVTP